MAMTLPLDQIQGNITPGFRKDHQAFLFFQWGTAAEDIANVQAWLKAIQPFIASAREVATFNRVFSLVKKRMPQDESQVLQATWVNVGLSARGLQHLTSTDELNSFPPAFRSPPGGRLNEPDDKDARAQFEFGGTIETVPDAIVIIGADRVESLRREVFRQLDLASKLSLTRAPYIGESLGDATEHFGFRDGLSQPDPDNPLDGWPDTGSGENIVAPGEFILGQAREARPGEADLKAFEGPCWAKNGSYLVFRKLRQHVDRFEKEVTEFAAAIDTAYHDAANPDPTNPKELLRGIASALTRAKLMGRWSSGLKLTDLVAALPANDPVATYGTLAAAPDDKKTIFLKDFADDSVGAFCPLFAHVRKANPRNTKDARIRRIIRRGITYGPRPTDRSRDDGQDRGLYFLAYQADIQQQFEFIQMQWLNDDASKEELPATIAVQAQDAGTDPIAGVRVNPDETLPAAQLDDLRTSQRVAVQLWEGDGLHHVKYPTSFRRDQPVTVKASAYFFVPSIDAITKLSTRQVPDDGNTTGQADTPTQ
jgi:Dyp-type peroxidase family